MNLPKVRTRATGFILWQDSRPPVELPHHKIVFQPSDLLSIKGQFLADPVSGFLFDIQLFQTNCRNNFTERLEN